MKTKIFRIYFYVLSGASLSWWTLSHWVCPDAYHGFLGFQGYDLPFVRVIGTLSFFSVLGMIFVARDPVRNRDFFISLLIISGLMVTTYYYLIQTNQFPGMEYFNIILLLVNSIIASLLYPWQEAMTLIYQPR